MASYDLDSADGTQAISAASLPLPTGAATSALQTTANTSLASIDTKTPALGQAPMSGSTPVVFASDQSALSVTGAKKASYSASTASFTMAGSATDVFIIAGSASKTVRVRKVVIQGFQTQAGSAFVYLIRRSTANSGGTSAAVTAVTHDTANASATASVLRYTANPTTLGTTVGTISSAAVYFSQSSNYQTPAGAGVFIFGKDVGQEVVLRGTSQVLALNLGGVTVSGSSVTVSVEWSEE